ncbi:PAQR family membrane homeostasis protein TrhA [Sinomonas humi]|uniref:Hemolysin III n=1 Tax=Sinomonas humi TaxID=1338436 RepID=A0A0B2AK81_9MICC|nr:hemolysin III family protein [Sinomonas humi]KHL02245.1 hemolysin III [Sinomonas humi]
MRQHAVTRAELLALKPSWRGWIHTVAAPLALVAGIVLVALAPTPDRKIACAVYAFTGLALFSVSAVYHRGNWSPRVKAILKRIDHTNIVLVIAGTYTPLSWVLLPRPTALGLLIAVWGAAALTVLFRVIWVAAPRWLYVPIYIALGCAAFLFLPQFFAADVPAAILVCIGGAFYIAGAVFYGIRRPNFSWRHFGFHEFFHAFTVAGFAVHFVAIMVAILGAPGL